MFTGYGETLGQQSKNRMYKAPTKPEHFVRAVQIYIEVMKNAMRTEFNNGIIEGIINKMKEINLIIMLGRCSS